MEILFLIYIVIGILLTIYWWEKEQKQLYEEARKSEEGVEKGAIEIYMMGLAALWPIKLIKNLIKKGKI